MIGTPSHRRVVLAFCLLVAAALPGQAAEEVVVDVPPQPGHTLPSGESVVLLVRTTLLTLNDALATGNFTVLRDRGAPSFREANSAARLSQIFSDLASRRVDLSAVSIATPQLSEAPTVNPEKGTLHVTGYFDTRPSKIAFELLYESVNGRWTLYGLSVQASDPRVAAGPGDPPPAQ